MKPEKLKSLRRRYWGTQAALAAELGVYQSAVSYWERGKSGIPGPAVKLLRILVKEKQTHKGAA